MKSNFSQSERLDFQDHKSDALTTRLPTGAADLTMNLCYLCTQLIYTVASPDPNPKSAILC